ELSNTITGFSTIGAGIKNLVAGVPALAWRFGMAPLARQTLGRAAYWTRDEGVGKGKELRAQAGEKLQLALDSEKEGKKANAEAERREAAKLEKEAGK